MVQAYVRDTIAKQLYTMLFLACLAPVARIGGVVPQVFAKLGQRTLHAYLLNVFFFFLGSHFRLTVELFMPKAPAHIILQYTTLVFATSVACCPLSEWCFGYLTSPQWIFSAGAKVWECLHVVTNSGRAMVGERAEQILSFPK